LCGLACSPHAASLTSLLRGAKIYYAKIPFEIAISTACKAYIVTLHSLITLFEEERNLGINLGIAPKKGIIPKMCRHFKNIWLT